jgi:Sulfotransferase domain
VLILCDGMVRSASTWSFNVALKLVRACDGYRKAFGLYDEDPAVLLAAARPRLSHVIIKSHKLVPSGHELCCSGAVKAIYTWRHPYDAAASCMRMFGFSFEQARNSLCSALRVWSFHRATDSACIIPYEQIVTNAAEQIERIASYLGLSATPEIIRQVAEETSFQYLKRLSQRIDTLESPRLVRKDGCLFDRETLLHKNHIRNGGVGYGARFLNRAQLSDLDGMLRQEGFEFLCRPHWWELSRERTDEVREELITT